MSFSKKSFVEFHDSQVSKINRGRDEVSIEFPHAYVYEFEAVPFEVPGVGLSQKARIVLTGVREASIPELPIEDEDDIFDVWDGTIWVNGEPIRNVFALPLDIQSANIRLELLLSTGTLNVSCSGITYEGLNEPTFVERYRA